MISGREARDHSFVNSAVLTVVRKVFKEDGDPVEPGYSDRSSVAWDVDNNCVGRTLDGSHPKPGCPHVNKKSPKTERATLVRKLAERGQG